jgi:ubiquinol-cytochrome c reductase cytochrome b subunit
MSGPQAESDVIAEHASAEEGVPFFPHHFLKEAAVGYLMIGLAIALIALAPAVIRGPADAFKTPPHIKPEWYFLAMYQFLKLFPAQVPVLSHIPGVRAIVGEGRAASIVIQGIAFLILIALPFLDRNPERHPRRRPFVITLGAVAVCAVAGLALWGHLS